MYCNNKAGVAGIMMFSITLGLMTQVFASDVNDNADASKLPPPPPGPYRIVPQNMPAEVNQANERSGQRNVMPQRTMPQQGYAQQRPPLSTYQQSVRPPVMPQQQYQNVPSPQMRQYAAPQQVPQTQQVPQQAQQLPQTRQQRWNAYPPVPAQPPVASNEQVEPQGYRQQRPAYPMQAPPAWAARPVPQQPGWGQSQYARPYPPAPAWGYAPQNTMPPPANWQRPGWGYGRRY